MFELKKIGKHWLIRPTGGQFSQLDIPIGAKHVEITDTFLVIDEQVYEIKASGNIAYVEKLPVISLTEEKHEPRIESSDASVIQPPVPSENLTSHQENIKSHAEPEKNADRNISTGIEDAHTVYDSLEASHTEETSEIEIIQVKKKDNDDERNNLSKGASGESPLHSPLNEEGKEEQINELIAEVEAANINLSQDMPSNRLDSVLSDKHMEHNYQKRETLSSKTANKTNESDKPTFGKKFRDMWKNNKYGCWILPRGNQLVVGEIDSSCLTHVPVIILTEQNTPDADYLKSPLVFSIQLAKNKYESRDKMKRALQTIESIGTFDILVVVKNVHKSTTLKVILYEIFEWLNDKSQLQTTVFFGCSTADIYKMLTELILEAEPYAVYTENNAGKLEKTADKIPGYQKSPLAFSIQVPTERWTKHKHEALDKMKRALQTIERSGAFDILVVVKNVHKSATLRVVLYEIFQWLKYKSKFRTTVFFGCSTAGIYKMLTELILEAEPSTDFTVNDASKQEERDTDTSTNIRQEPYMYKDKQVQKSQKLLTPIANETASLGLSSSRRCDDVVNRVQTVEDVADKAALEIATCTDYQPKCAYSSGQKYFRGHLDMPIQRKENNEQSMQSEFDVVPDPVRVPLPAEIVFHFLKSKYKADFLEFEQTYGNISFQAGDMVIPYMEENRCRKFVNKFKMYSENTDVLETNVETEHVNTVKEWCEELKKEGKFCQFDLESMQFYLCCENYDDLIKFRHRYKVITLQVRTPCRGRKAVTVVYSNDLEKANPANEQKKSKD